MMGQVAGVELRPRKLAAVKPAVCLLPPPFIVRE